MRHALQTLTALWALSVPLPVNAPLEIAVHISPTWASILHFSTLLLSIQTNDATGRMTALSQEAYNAFLTSYYYTGRNCLPSTEGATTTSNYDTFYDFGYVTTSADTSKFVGYMCAPRVVLNQAETVQAVVAAFIAAASLMYIA